MAGSKKRKSCMITTEKPQKFVIEMVSQPASKAAFSGFLMNTEH